MIKVEKKTGIYDEQIAAIRVRERFGRIYLLIDKATVELTVPRAFDLGMAIIKQSNGLLPQEYLSIKINGKEIKLLERVGLQLGGAILRKCDSADDFQQQRTKP